MLNDAVRMIRVFEAAPPDDGDPITAEHLMADHEFRVKEPGGSWWPPNWKMIEGQAYHKGAKSHSYAVYLQKSNLLANGWYATVVDGNAEAHKWVNPLWTRKCLRLFLELLER